MNPEYTISNKIVMMEDTPNFNFFKNNMVLLNNVNERYLIKDQPTPANPSQPPKPKHFINQRNVTAFRYFSKINLNNSAPNLLIINPLPKPNAPQPPPEATKEEEVFCKICFESTSTEATGKLIAPCLCSGSVKYIHEECLKTWLVSQNVDLKLASCELCHLFYKMELRLGLKFFPQEACRHGLQNALAVVCLLIFLGCLVVIIIMFSLQWKEQKSEDRGNFSYQVAIIASCSVVAFVVLVLIYMTGKETCFLPYIKQWLILEPKKKENQKENKIIKIDKKKIAPKNYFKIKPPVENTNNLLQKQIQNFFQRKSNSEGNFFKQKLKQKQIVKSTIMRIESKILKKTNENTFQAPKLQKNHSLIIKCRKILPDVRRSLQYPQKFNSKLEIKNIFSNQMPSDFLMQEKEDEKIVDVLMETHKKQPDP